MQLLLNLLDRELGDLVGGGELIAETVLVLAEELFGELPVDLSLRLPPIRPLTGGRLSSCQEYRVISDFPLASPTVYSQVLQKKYHIVLMSFYRETFGFPSPTVPDDLVLTIEQRGSDLMQGDRFCCIQMSTRIFLLNE